MTTASFRQHAGSFGADAKARKLRARVFRVLLHRVLAQLSGAPAGPAKKLAAAPAIGGQRTEARSGCC